MHPILFQYGPVTLYSFGFMVAVGFLVAAMVAAADAPRHGLRRDDLLDAATWVVLAGLAGARLLYVVLHWSEVGGWSWNLVAIWKGGMSFHGGLVGGALALAIFARVRGLPLAALLDAVAPALAIGYAIGRVGCLLNGCCHGHATDLPWAMRFPSPQGGWTEPSHPTQIYASIAGLALFALLRAARPHLARPGQLAALCVVGYSVYRFLVEFARRGASANVLALGLTEAQWASLVLAAGATAAVLALQRAPAKRPLPGESESPVP